MINFIYKEYIEERYENGTLEPVEDELEEVRGMALSNGEILINLSAIQWKDLEESKLTEELSKTIIHEQIHLLIDDVYEDEEKICQIMSDQIEIGAKIVPR